MKIIRVRKKIGLGDAIEAVAKPIARTIDAVIGSGLSRCGGCARRRERLNRSVPNINPFARDN